MPRTMQPQPIEEHLMSAFEWSLEQQDVDEVENIGGDIEDLYGILGDNEEPLRPRDLPRAIPEVVRQRVLELARQRDGITKELERMVRQLDRAAAKISAKKEREWQASQPRCPNCQQILPLKKRSAR